MFTKKRILCYIILYLLCLVIVPVKPTIDIKPETFINTDLIFPNGGNEYFYAAGYFTTNSINTYLKNQGYSLAQDTSVIIYYLYLVQRQ